jgi:hypothetical protein
MSRKNIVILDRIDSFGGHNRFEDCSMKNDYTRAPNAYSLAHDGLANTISAAHASFAQECQRIQEHNKPKIAALEKRLDYLRTKRCGLLQQIEPLLSQGVGGTRTLFLSLLGALCFALVGFVLSRKTIEPFQLGLSGEVFSFGLTLLLPYAIDRIIRRFSLQRLVPLMLDMVLVLTAIATMVAFSGIRADVFRHALTGGEAVVFDSLGTSLPAPDESANKVADLLRWAWISAALGFELACGLCWSDFAESRRGSNAGLLNKLEKKLLKVEQQYFAAITEIQERFSEPQESYSRQWADFRRGLSDAMARLGDVAGRSGRAAALILVGFLAAHTAMGADPLHLVAEVDLSATEKVVGFGARSQFEENIAVLPQLLANLPAGARVSLVGITDQTLSNPLIVLGARLSDDSGYFDSRLVRGRRDLISEWQSRTKGLKPTAPHTDVIGGFMFAGEVFSHSNAERKVLAFFSDMRNEQPGVLDLERPETIIVTKSIKAIEKQGLIPDLRGVQIYIFGAGDHSAKKRPEYLVSLRAFWAEYVRRSGATLRVFSTTRDPEVLREVISGLSAKSQLP